MMPAETAKAVHNMKKPVEKDKSYYEAKKKVKRGEEYASMIEELTYGGKNGNAVEINLSKSHNRNKKSTPTSSIEPEISRLALKSTVPVKART